MTEAQVKAGAPVHEQLVTARKELAQLRAIKPLLSGVTLHAGPGLAVVHVGGLVARQLASLAEAMEAELLGQIAALEQRLAVV